MSPRRNAGGLISSTALVLNVVSIIYGGLFVAVRGKAPLPTLFGVILLAALTLNIALTFIYFKRGAGLKMQRWSGAYLVLSMAAMAAMSLGGFAASSVYDPRSATIILCAVVYPAYFATLAVGALLARLTLREPRGVGAAGGEGGTTAEPGRFTRGRIVLLAVLFPLLASGLFSAYILLSHYPGLLQVPVSPSALFLAFFYPALAVLILKVYRKPHCPVSSITGAVGLFLFLLFMLPLLMTPAAAARAEADFSAAFGADWRERLNPAHESRFLEHRFSLPAYFLGYPSGDYTYQRDILFYEGTSGVDEGVQLYFDVFAPPAGQEGLPGEGSTIIRIHGGAWIAGNKGPANMLQMNKYLAAQGYTVFDVQYGLNNSVNIPQIMMLYDFLSFFARRVPASPVISGLGAPTAVTGPFTLDDIVRHIGIFTGYLAEHGGEYGASLNAVFISGGSAGGQLATAAALAMAGGAHNHIFNSGITIKGYVPFYPANKATKLLESIGGAAEWVDVELLVRQDSPPCLIFQGTRDGMVPPDTARSFRDRYREAGNVRCAVLYQPLGAHASDYQFTGYYNQVFLYYMERFLALHR